jgi:hypothetical protein
MAAVAQDVWGDALAGQVRHASAAVAVGRVKRAATASRHIHVPVRVGNRSGCAAVDLSA